MIRGQSDNILTLLWLFVFSTRTLGIGVCELHASITGNHTAIMLVIINVRQGDLIDWFIF